MQHIIFFATFTIFAIKPMSTNMTSITNNKNLLLLSLTPAHHARLLFNTSIELLRAEEITASMEANEVEIEIDTEMKHVPGAWGNGTSVGFKRRILHSEIDPAWNAMEGVSDAMESSDTCTEFEGSNRVEIEA